MKIDTLYITVGLLVLLLSAACTDSRPQTKTIAHQRSAFTPDAVTLREAPGTNFKELVDEKLTFIDSAGLEWTAPRGTLTDGASVPRLALSG